jgi:hypothetical protein
MSLSSIIGKADEYEVDGPCGSNGLDNGYRFRLPRLWLSRRSIKPECSCSCSSSGSYALAVSFPFPLLATSALVLVNEVLEV